jgi:hypothetical protein
MHWLMSARRLIDVAASGADGRAAGPSLTGIPRPSRMPRCQHDRLKRQASLRTSLSGHGAHPAYQNSRFLLTVASRTAIVCGRHS